jgi:hypothetical protein
VLFKPSDGKFRFGPRAGFLAGFGSNSISSPAASPLFDYSYVIPWILYYELETDWCVDWPSERSRLIFSLGAASVNRSIVATMHNFNFQQNQQNNAVSFNSSSTPTGITGSLAWGVRVSPLLEVDVGVRVIHIPGGTFNVPNPVQIGADNQIFVTLAARYSRDFIRNLGQ